MKFYSPPMQLNMEIAILQEFKETKACEITNEGF